MYNLSVLEDGDGSGGAVDLDEVAGPDLLGGAKTFMIGSLIEEQFKGNAGNWPFGAAGSMILLSMVLVVLPVHLSGIDGLRVFFFLFNCLLTSLELSGSSNCL